MHKNMRPCVFMAVGLAGLFASLNLCGQVDVPRTFIVISNNAVAGPGTLTKTGAGILSLMSPSGNTFSNDIVVGVDGGTLRIGGNPFIAAGTSRTGTTLPNMTTNNTVTIQRGGIFEIKDSSVTTFGYVPNRLGSAGNRPKVSVEGGSLLYNGASIASTMMTQSVGVVTITSGATITANRGTGTPVLMGDSFIMTPGAFVSFVGTGLGTAATDQPKILFGTAPSLVGASGADGTTTKSILKGARFGSDLVTYGANGIRALATAEYNSVALNDINGAGATENVRLTIGTAAIPVLTAPKTINSLVQNMSVNGTWAMGNTLTLTSGELLVNRALAISSGSLTAGAGSDEELHVIGIATTTMAGNINDNGAGSVSLVKSGVGTLTLGAATDNTYSGGTVVNEGTLTTSGTTANRRFFGTGPVKVDNAALTMTAIGSTANALGDDYTAVNAAQINLAALAYTADDTFNISAGSVVSGTAVPLNTLDRGRNDSATTNITLAADAVIAHPALTTALNLDTGTIKNLGNDADLFYGLNAAQASAAGNVTIGNGTAFKGISTPRAAGAWNLGTINVAAGTENIYLQGLTIPGTVPFALSLGNNALVAGGPVINLADSGSVDAQVLNYVTLDDNLAVYGDAVNKLNFVVNSGALLTLNQTDSMGSGSGIATAEVKDGGTLALLNPAAINGDVTFEGGSLIKANNAGGLIGSGALAFEAGSLIELGHAVGFSGPQAAAATVEPGAIVRLNITGFGSATDPLNNYFIGKSPIYELYGALWHINPVAANTTILTLNRGEDGKGGMLVNRDAASSITAVPNGVVAIGPNGGVIAATPNMLLTLPQAIALSSNELVIGSTEMIDRIMLPKLGIVALTAPSGYNTAANGSKITIVPGAQLNNAANSLPDAAEVAVAGIFNVAGSDAIGALSGTGQVAVANSVILSTGRNDADASFSGVLTSGGTASQLVKAGDGRQDLRAASAFAGKVTVNGGELALGGNGTLAANDAAAAFTLIGDGALHLDNSETDNGNRLTGAAPGVTFQGGTFRFTGKDNTASSESLGAATFASGGSTIDIVNGTNASAVVTFSTATPGAGTVNFTASNGTLGSSGNNPRVKFTGLPAGLVGYGTVGSAPAYHDATYGIRAYTLGEGTEFNGTAVQTALNTVFTTNNVYPTLSAARTVYSLWIDSPGTGKFVDMATYGLLIGSGRISLTGTNNFEIKQTSTGTIANSTANGKLFLGVDNAGTTLTVSAPLASGTGTVDKDGAGTLVLNAANTFTTGGLFVNDGTVKYGASGLLADTAALTTQNDGVFDISGKTDTIGAVTLFAGGITNSIASGALTISTLTMGSGPAGSSAYVHTGTGTLKLGGTVTYNVLNDPDPAVISGALDLNGATRTFAVGDSVAPGAYIDMDIPATITGGLNIGVAKTLTGTMRLGGNNTFDGPVTVTGTLRLNHPKALGKPSAARVLTLGALSSLVFDGSNGDIALPANYTPVSLNTVNTLVGPISGSLVNWSGNNSISGAVTVAAITQIASLKAGDKLTLSGAMSGNFAFTVNGDGDTALLGARGGNASATLVKNGSGTLTIGGSGANTFAGPTTVSGGKLVLAKTGGVAALVDGAVGINNGGTLQYAAGTANQMGTPIVTINGSGSLDFNGATDTIGNLVIVANAAASPATSDTTAITNSAGGGNLTIGTLTVTPAPGFLSRLDSGSGTLTLGGNVGTVLAATGRTQISGKLDLGAATRTFTPVATTYPFYDMDIDAVISGGAGVGLTTATGRLRLSGANTYPGDTTISSGTLRLGNAEAIPHGAGKGIVVATGILDLNGLSPRINGLTGAGTVDNLAVGGNCTLYVGDDNRTSTYKGIIKNTVGTVALCKIGTGTLELTGNSTLFTGGTTISNGTVLATLSVNALGTGVSTVKLAGGNLALTNAAALAFNRPVVVAENGAIITDIGAAGAGVTHTLGTLSIGSQTLGVRSGLKTTSGIAGLTLGATTLSGSPTIAITDPVNGGTTKLTLGAVTDNGNFITLAGNGDFVQSAVWSAGTGGLILGDAFSGSATLGYANLFTGGVAISNGLVVLGVATGLGPAGNAVVTFGPATTNGVLRVNGFGPTIAGLNSLARNAVVENGHASTAVTLTINNAADASYAGLLQNGGAAALALTKSGVGTLTLSGTNTYTGLTTVNAGGVLDIRNGQGLGTTAAGTTVASGGALQLQGGIAIGAEALTTLSGTGVANGGAIRNVSGTNSYGGLITLALAGTRINSDAGLLTLDVASGNAIAGAFNVVFGGEGDITVADPIAIVAGTLTKDGNGTLTLSGVNPFTGATTVNGGTLRVATTNALIASTSVTVAPGGTLEPGAFGAAGSTTYISKLTLGTGSIVKFEFAEGVNDKINVTGAAASSLTLTGGGVLLYAQGTTDPWTTGGRYNLFKYNSTLGGSVANLSVLNPQPNLVYTFVASGGWVSLIVADPTQAHIWDGGSLADSNWMTDENWSDDATPDPVSVLTFAGATRLAITNDYSANTPFSGLIFDSTAGAFTLSGNTVNLLGNVTNSSPNAQTINLPLVLELASRTFSAEAGDIAIGGTISETAGGLGLVKIGTNTLTLAGANSFSGAADIQSGVVNVRNNAGLGTVAGGVTVTNGATLQVQDGIAIGAEAVTLNGMGVSSNGALRSIDGANSLAGVITLASDARINSDDGTLRLDPASGNAIAGTGRAVTFGGAGDIVVPDPIGTGAAGSLTKDGSGTLTLSAANTFTGPTRIEAGRIRATSILSALGGAGQLQIAGGTLEIANDAALALSKNAVTISGNSALVADRLSTVGAGVVHTFGTLAVGDQSVSVNGGYLVTNGTAGVTFTGTTTLGGSPTFAINDPINGGITKLTLGAIGGSDNFITLTGNGDFAQSGIWGAGAGGIILGSSFSGLATLSQANLFTGGATIKAGTLAGTVAGAFGATAVPITLGNTSGSANATLMGSGAVTFAQPIAVTAGNTGKAFIASSANATFSGPVNLDNHDLSLFNTTAGTLTLSGGISGTGNILLDIQGNRTITLSTLPVNPVGAIVNAGSGTGTATISGGVGTNVTAITESSTNSALTIVTGALSVHTNGTTLANDNPSGIRVLTLSSAVNGIGDLILRNNSAIANGVTVSGSPNHTGLIINSGTGTGITLLSGILGANVAGVIQNSPTSLLAMSGNSSAYTNGVTIKAGMVSGASSANCFGTGASTITLGDAAGSFDAALMLATTFSRPVIVTGGNTGLAIITNNAAAGISGSVTLNNHDLRLSPSAYTLTMSGGFSGAGNLSLLANGAGLVTLSAKPVNNAGTITSSGTGSGAVAISGGVGSNITAIVQNATNSTLTVGTVALTVNENGTTLVNNNVAGAKVLTLSGAVNGTGDLILRNNSAIANGITVSGAPNHRGQLINAGTGYGNTLISGIIGPNVTNVVQASETSVLTLSGANTFPFGVAVASNMTVRIANIAGSATGTGVVSIATGGTIDGSGFMSGPVVLSNGAILSPSINGRTAGRRLTLGALEWHGGGVLDCVVTKIDSALGGTDYGQISVSGAFTGLPGDTNLVIRLDTLGQTFAVNPARNYGLKLITFETAGMATNLNLSSILVDTNAFLVTGGTWSLTNMFNNIYLVNMPIARNPNANVWIAPGYVQSGGTEHLYFDYWSRSNNWSLGHAPIAGEDVVFDFDSQKECWINFITNSIGSLTLTPGYGNTLVFWTGFPGEGFYSNFVVTGEVLVESGNMRHMAHETGGDVEVNRMVLTVGGDFTLGASSTINLDGLGYRAGYGPGAGNGLLSAASRSASHGGAGASNVVGKTTYGSITQPEDLGSGAYGPGGGALFLQVGGTATIDGVISARGTGAGATTCAGAGGSIFIKAGGLAGSGIVHAGASTNTPYYGSGGGRIALIATNGSTIGTMTIRANTHAQTRGGGGRAGTVYLETTAFKRLIIDQESIGSASANYTDLAAPTETFATDPALGGPLENVTLILTNNAFVRLNQDLRMGDVAWLSGGLSLESHSLYLKAATPAGTFPDDYGAGTVTLPGVFYTFANGESITRDGRILWGDPATTWRVITMVHDDVGGTATNKGEVNEGYFPHGSSLEFEATPTSLAFRFWDGTIAEGKPSTIDNPLIVSSLDRNSVFRAWFADPIVNQTYLEWLPSAGSDDWFAPYNWDLLMVPVAGQIVTIPAGSTVRINDATPVLGSLSLAAGSTLTFEGWNSSLEATMMTVSGRVTHLPQTVIEPNEAGEWVPQHRIWLKGQNLLLASTGMLDADGKGYKPGAGPGAAPAQTGDGDDGTGYNCGGGGGYGGPGAAIQSQRRGEAYGTPDDPWQPGSGGGYRPAYFGQNAKPAGGAIRIDMTGQVTLDGIASARGTDPVGQGTAGSGGGIALYCQTLTGATSGWVRVDGGKGYPSGGSGGGGRIALHYNPAAQAALPDPRPPIRFSAAAGYILNPAASQTTILPVMGTLYMPDTTLLAATPTGAVVLDDQRFWHTRLYLASHPASWSPASLLIENCWIGFPENYTLQVGGNLTLSGTQAPLSGTERAGLHLFATNSVNLYGSQLRVGRDFTVGSETWFYPHTDGHSAAIVGTRVGGNFTVAAGGGVNADMDGYIAVNDNSNGPGAGLINHAGGSYGGWGGITNIATGVTNGVARPPYGDAALPLDPGSPGAWSGYGNYTPAGRGGGVIHVLAGGQMLINGTLTANGGNGVYAGGNGGSGGSIFLSTSGRLNGNGTLQARGASVDSRYVSTRHPGGGGRIAVWQFLSANAAETRVANHNIARLTKVDTLPGFSGVVNVLEGPLTGHGATAGTAEFYISRLNVLILR